MNTSTLLTTALKSFIIFCMISFLIFPLFSQPNCIIEEYQLMGWFKTDANDRKVSPNGIWVDEGPDGLQLYGVPTQNDNCDDPKEYEQKVLSMNFNPALIFDDDRYDFEFRLRNSRKTDVTIFAVLVPRERFVSNSEEYSVQFPYLGRVRSLDIDFLNIASPFLAKHEEDYGSAAGTDLKVDENEGDPEGPGTYEYEKYGKIVTYSTVLRPDRSMTVAGMINQIYNIYSLDENRIKQTGQVPEFLVYSGIMDDENRTKVETYLAVKYGISKEKDFVSCTGDFAWKEIDEGEYSFRKTGISNDKGFFLNQSRSNSYYEETSNIWDGRLDPDFFYNTEQDFSHHRSRLLTIGIEDEVSTIEDRWEYNYHVWGDDNNELVLTESTDPDLIYLERTWRMKVTSGGEATIPNIRWCNAIDIINESTESTTAVLRQKFAMEEDRIAYCASSTSIREVGELKFDVDGNGNGSIIGFSSDNMNFADQYGNGQNYLGYIFAIKFGPSAQVVYDTDGDGLYDMSEDLSITGPYNLSYQRNVNGQHEFSVNGNPYILEHVCPGGIFAKLHILSNQFSFTEVDGTGFKESHPNATNVEFSVDRVEDIPSDPWIPVLIQDSNGGNTLDANSSDLIRGNYSYTPGGYADRIEFVNIEWGGDSAVELFTLGFYKCDGESLTVSTTGCCTEETNVSFVVETCLPEDEVYYEMINTETGVYENNGYSTAGSVTLGSFLPGDYELHVYFPGCNKIVEELDIQSTFIPEELTLENCVLVNECAYIVDLPDDTFITIKKPDGQNVNTYIGGDCIVADQIGTYVIEAILECDDEIICSSYDTFEAVTIAINPEFEQCCNCNYLTINPTSDCFSGLIVDYTVNLWGQPIQGETIVNGEPILIDHCYYSGNGSVSIETDNGYTITEPIFSTIQPLPTLNLPPYNSSDTYCLDYNELWSQVENFTLDEKGVFFIYDENNINIARLHTFNNTVCLYDFGCYTIEIDLDCPGNNSCVLSDEICIDNPCSSINLDLNCDGLSDANNIILSDELEFCLEGSSSCGKSNVYVTFTNVNDMSLVYEFPSRLFQTFNPYIYDLVDIPDGEYTVDILIDPPCGGCSGFFNIPVIIEHSPCSSVNIDSKCSGNEKSFCINNLPEDCIPFYYELSDDNGVIIQTGYSSTTVLEFNLEDGNYTLAIKAECLCQEITITFNVDNTEAGPLREYYCGDDVIEMSATNLCSEANTCIVWKRYENSEEVILQEGFVSDNCTFLYSHEPGRYNVSTYDCVSNELLGQNFFTIYDGCLPLSDRIDVEEFGCNDEGMVVQLSYKDTIEEETYLLYKIFEATSISHIFKEIKNGVLINGDTTYVYDLIDGEYLLQTVTREGYITSMPLQISEVHRLPSEIIVGDTFRIDVNENIYLDASESVNYAATYEWEKDDAHFSNDPSVIIVESGQYSVTVSTSDCVKTEYIEVEDDLSLRSLGEIEQSGIDLIFRNPILEQSSLELRVVNEKLQEITTVDIYTVAGKIVYHNTFFNKKDHFTSINLRGGMYFIRAENSSGDIIFKKVLVVN